MTVRERQFWKHFDQRAASWRDGGPDDDLLQQMTKVERRRVEAVLLDRLRTKPDADDWVPMALGELRSRRALPLLRPLVADAKAAVRVAAAEALWKICAEPGAVAAIIEVLRTRPRGKSKRRPTSFDRVDAACALGHIDTPASRAALRRALRDPDYLVAANAKSALRILRTGVFDPFQELLEEGWTETRNPDGTITYSRPRPQPRGPTTRKACGRKAR